MFSDDAYNKFIGNAPHAGTLVGNWAEERAIRDATGEGRSVPMRHMKRSGLLKDFTKVPSGGFRKMDNTFERVYGPKAQLHDHGGYSAQEMLEAEKRIPRVGPKSGIVNQNLFEIAHGEVGDEDAITDARQQDRFFETSTGVVYTKPDETKAEKATMARKSCSAEIMHGPSPSRSAALLNAGLEVQNNVHYANSDAPTYARVSLGDSSLRGGVNVSACGGISAFGKHAQFTMPVQNFTAGPAKDEELVKMYDHLSGTDSLRTLQSSRPLATTFSQTPSLTALKEAVHKKVFDVYGEFGYISLRQKLYDMGDHEGFLKKADVVGVLRHDLGLTEEELNTKELDVYLNLLCTMKKSEFRASSFMSSLRPSVPQKTRRRVMQMFSNLGPANGTVRLGSWLGQLQNAALRETLVKAFGGESEDMVAETPITEQVLTELFADLAPFADVEALFV